MHFRLFHEVVADFADRRQPRCRRLRPVVSRTYLRTTLRFLPWILLATTLGAMPATAQVADAPAPPSDWASFTRTFDSYVARDSIIGASVLVVRDGHVSDRDDHGWGDRALGQPAGPATIYHWGSITKTLTAVAVMQLRDRGRLTLDDRVTDYISELRQVHNPYGSMDDVTVRMLLSHSAGFQNPTWPYDRGEPWEPFEPTTWEQLVAMMPYQRLHFPPGSRYGYSNPAFIYLARIIEQLTGDAWQTYVYKNLLIPLGMTRSYFGTTPYHLARVRSNNYTVTVDDAGREAVLANGRDFDPGITIPNGGWNAPLGDLVRWIAFLTHATGGDGATASRFDTVLRRASLKEMWEARYLASDPVAATNPDAPADSMGLSFFVLWRHNTRFVGHTGSQAGFRAFLYIDPASRAAVLAAFNTRNDARPEESALGFSALRDEALRLIAR
ncbi:MAG: beta-lactamase family protein [Gemmatimonadota bacterium]|nr:beta-lactamase family protein [Gemmatimonadota bacterium]